MTTPWKMALARLLAQKSRPLLAAGDQRAHEDGGGRGHQCGMRAGARLRAEGPYGWGGALLRCGVAKPQEQQRLPRHGAEQADAGGVRPHGRHCEVEAVDVGQRARVRTRDWHDQ